MDMNNLVICENRLKSILVVDKKENPLKIINVVKSELLYVLKNYMDINAENFDVEIFVNEKGEYVLNINGKCKMLKMASII